MKQKKDAQEKIIDESLQAEDVLHNEAVDMSETSEDAAQALSRQVVALQKDVEEWKGKYLRALADYQNLEKRTFAEKKEIRKYAAQETLRAFLPAIDSLEAAQAHLQDEGLALTLKEFYAVLAACGAKRIEVIGKPYDPYTMECIEVVEGDAEKVTKEAAAGYMFHDKLLRVAKVYVGGGKKA